MSTAFMKHEHMLQSPDHLNKGKIIIQQTCDTNTTYSGINMGSQQQRNTVVVEV